MKLTKITALTMSVAIAGSAMTGCGGSSNDPAPTGDTSASSDSGEQVNLKWALWDVNATPYYQTLIDEFRKENPNINIEMVDLGSADYSTMLNTQLSGGADLDVLTIKDIPGYANLVRQNHLEPLDTYVQESGIDTSLYGGITERYTNNDVLYALPYRSDFWITYYNKDLFDQAGVEYPTNDMTVAEYDALARKMTSGDGGEKVYGDYFHTWRSAVQIFGLLDGEHTVIDGNYDFLKPYYEMAIAQQDDGICQDYATLKTTSTHYSGVFYNNQTSMLHMGSWFIAMQMEKVKTGESLATNWGIVSLPHPEGVEAGTSAASITGLAVNSNSKNKEAALEFAKFVSGPEGANIVAETGNFPAIMSDEVIDTITSREGFPSDPQSKEALKVSQTYLEIPPSEFSADIEIILNEEHDAIMTKNNTIDEGIANMNERVSQVLGK